MVGWLVGWLVGWWWSRQTRRGASDIRPSYRDRARTHPPTLLHQRQHVGRRRARLPRRAPPVLARVVGGPFRQRCGCWWWSVGERVGWGLVGWGVSCWPARRKDGRTLCVRTSRRHEKGTAQSEWLLLVVPGGVLRPKQEPRSLTLVLSFRSKGGGSFPSSATAAPETAKSPRRPPPCP